MNLSANVFGQALFLSSGAHGSNNVMILYAVSEEAHKAE